jgi:gliding motility associated protien GldN
MMKKLGLIVSLFGLTWAAPAQCNLSTNVPTALNPAPTPPPVPYPFVREADVMWSKRIWRMIDLREKMNLPLYYPVTPNADRISMWDAIYCAVKTHEITIYQVSPFDYDNSFEVPLTRTEADSALLKILRIDTGSGSKLESEHLGSDDIVSYMLKEDWIFDKQRSVLDSRILGICPFKKMYDDQGNEIPGCVMMFWIYYPEIRHIFSKVQVFNPHNNYDRRSLEAVFMKRMFSSYILQESNVYNRRISDYMKNNLDALLEGEAIKDKVREFENDMWQY